MSELANKAVFLSYASQDAEAARRICDALRAAGVEVWFDQSELRGGDAWDQKIRKQIKECALFVPVISANTQSRHEGYFRLEWKLAAERTHMMSGAKAFLLPVVIDDTRDADAHVPSEFRAVQWTRLPQGETAEGFCARLNSLLNLGAGAADQGRHLAIRGIVLPQPVRAKSRRFAIAATLGMVVFAVWVMWRWAEPAVQSVASAKSISTTTSEKSIAVLPFKNMSSEPDSVFFTDGVQEDILTHLFKIRDLRVVSRTSVEQYRGTVKPMKQIGQELGVAYLLEGSVRRAGGRVRVTGQLIDARSDKHVWADSYDRDLSERFAIQAELAKAIAGELRAALSHHEKSEIERKPTANLEAYDLFVRARAVRIDPVPTAASINQAKARLIQALQLDPAFVQAQAELAFDEAFSALVIDGSKAQIARAEAAAQAALRMAPDDPDVLACLGYYYYFCLRDYDRAFAQFARVAQLRPSDPALPSVIAAMRRRQGRWLEAVAQYQHAIEIDPGNFRNVRDIGILLAGLHRFDDAIAWQKRIVERRPEDVQSRFELAVLPLMARGSLREGADFVAQLTPAEATSKTGIALRKRWALLSGELAGFLQLEEAHPGSAPLTIAIVLAAQGNLSVARARLEGPAATLRATIEKEDSENFATLAQMDAVLGRSDEALRWAQRTMEQNPMARDALSAARARALHAFVLAWTGDKAGAVAEYARLVQMPFGVLNGGGGSYPESTIHVMKHDPHYAPLWGDAGFEALIADPTNNAPLF